MGNDPVFHDADCPFFAMTWLELLGRNYGPIGGLS